MMMTIEEIKQLIIAEKEKHEVLNEADSTSKVAIWNLWVYIIAVVAWSQYELWRIFKLEMDQKIAAQKLYTLSWYQEKALGFRYGHPLDKKGDFDSSAYTSEQIEASKMIARAAVVPLELNNRINLFIKVAKEENGVLQKLSKNELSGITEYFERIKPGGTKIVIYTSDPDDLRLAIDFFYDPLVFDENGSRIDGSNNLPVQDAIRDYISNLPFNGEFTRTTLIDRLQSIEGCAGEVEILQSSANYLTPPSYQQITSSYIANSGYMEVKGENLTINFVAKTGR